MASLGVADNSPHPDRGAEVPLQHRARALGFAARSA